MTKAGWGHAAFACALLGSACAPGRADSGRLGLDVYVPFPADNPPTTEAAELGQRLFFDPVTSRDRTVACASCHRPESAFSDGRATALGVRGQIGVRNTPSLFNRAHLPRLFHDGRARSLEEAVLQPIVNPLELDLPLDSLESRLRFDTGYAGEFEQVYGQPPERRLVVRALSSYLRTLIRGDAPYDRWYAGDADALSSEALRGKSLFLGKAPLLGMPRRQPLQRRHRAQHGRGLGF